MKKESFHLSLPCRSISETKDFYINIIGAKLGRHSSLWVDVDLFGNQITFNKSGVFDFSYKSYKFEDTVLPSFHFGTIIGYEKWNALFDKLQASGLEPIKKITFLKNKIGEHVSFFITDPNGFTVEFKSFTNQKEMFAY
ncbi:MAG: VOC family protein [Maribacter sp.]